MRRLCENARFPGLMRPTRSRACGCIRVGASLSPGKWMGAQARHRLLSWMIFCPHILSAQAKLLLVVFPALQDTSQSALRCRRLKMLHIRRETSGRSETLGKPVIPRLRTTAWAGSTRHQEAIVLTAVELTPNWTKGQKRAASEADVAGFEGRIGVDAMRACTDPSVYPQYDLQYQECDCFVLGTSEDGIRYVTCILEKERNTLDTSGCHQGSLHRISVPRAMQALCDARNTRIWFSLCIYQDSFLAIIPRPPDRFAPQALYRVARSFPDCRVIEDSDSS